MKQRIALWGALAALVLGAGTLVVFVGGGGGDGPPALRLAAGGDGAGDARAEQAADMPATALASVYVPGGGLPALGGEAPAYRLAGAVTAADVRDLAAALGIEGEATGTDGSWHVDDGEMALDVYGADGTWSAYRMVSDPGATPDAADAATGTSAGGGTSGSAGAAGSTGSAADDPATPPATSGVAHSCPDIRPGDNIAEVCPEPQCPSGPATDPPVGCEPICLDQPDVANDAGSCDPPLCPQYTPGGEAPAVDPDVVCPAPPCPDKPAEDVRCVPSYPAPTPVDPAPTDPVPTPVDPAPTPTPTTPPPPADLPGEDDARATALDLLAATGADVDGAEVTAENLVSMWSITVEPSVDGRPAPGLAMYVGVGPEGRIESATGRLAEPDELGDYPLIDTRDAITRLNEGWGFATPLGDVTALDAPAAAESSSGVASDQPANDDAGAADGIAGGAAPETERAPGGGPETTIEPVPAPGGPDQPVSDQPVSDQPTEVEVTDAAIVLVTVPSWDDSGTYLVPGYRFTAADDSQPTVPAVTDDVLEPPPATEQPDQAVPPVAEGDTVEVSLYHCGFDELRHDDRRWVVQDPPFDATNAPPEFVGKGTLAVDDGGDTAVYTDDSGIAVTFTAVGDDWEPPLCD